MLSLCLDISCLQYKLLPHYNHVRKERQLVLKFEMCVMVQDLDKTAIYTTSYSFNVYLHVYAFQLYTVRSY